MMKEFARVGVSVHMGPPYVDYAFRCPAGTALEDYFSPSMLAIIGNDFMDNFFRSALVARANKCEPLLCPVCDECQIAPSSKGTPSAKKRCIMTPRCDGILTRIRPPVFDLVMPKRKRKPRADRSMGQL